MGRLTDKEISRIERSVKEGFRGFVSRDRKAQTDFVVAALEDIPALCYELRRTREELDRVRPRAVRCACGRMLSDQVKKK